MRLPAAKGLPKLRTFSCVECSSCILLCGPFSAVLLSLGYPSSPPVFWDWSRGVPLSFVFVSVNDRDDELSISGPVQFDFLNIPLLDVFPVTNQFSSLLAAIDFHVPDLDPICSIVLVLLSRAMAAKNNFLRDRRPLIGLEVGCLQEGVTTKSRSRVNVQCLTIFVGVDRRDVRAIKRPLEIYKVIF